MIIEVELDPQDTSIDEATVSTLYVEEGEEVEEGDVLIEMVANDDTFNVTASVSGSVLEVHVEEEDVVKVGDVLCLIDTSEPDVIDEDEDEDDEDEDENEDEDE